MNDRNNTLGKTRLGRPREDPPLRADRLRATASCRGSQNWAICITPGVACGHLPGRTLQAAGTQMLNLKTCLLTVSVHGTCKVCGGTGKFARITRHEPAKRASWLFSPDPGKCA
jgi:hypothetical protein